MGSKFMKNESINKLNMAQARALGRAQKNQLTGETEIGDQKRRYLWLWSSITPLERRILPCGLGILLCYFNMSRERINQTFKVGEVENRMS
jgi:hypothetical protein